jgi:hypothetical protein
MFSASNPEKDVCNRHHAISLLFANDPELLNFFFTPDRQQLRWVDSTLTARHARYWLDVEQEILVRFALCLWLESDHGRLREAIHGLCTVRFECLLRAMELLHAARGCDCQNCRQRFPDPDPAIRLFSQQI